jgi:integrase
VHERVRKKLIRANPCDAVQKPRPARREMLSLTAAQAQLLLNVADAPLFCTRTGGHLDTKNVLRAFRTIVRRASAALDAAGQDDAKPILDGFRFHDLRHTVASLLLSVGHSLRAVAQRLGHSDLAMTLRVYARCLPTDDGQLSAAWTG